MPKLFSYGTLQQENVQQETFQRLLHGAKDTLVGYVIGTTVIEDPAVVALSGSDTHPILRYTGNVDDCVNGMVFDMSEDEILRADSYEV